MSSPSLEPDPTNVENIEPAQIEDDIDRSPEEKQNREQSAASDETAVNERGEERPRADTVPPA